MPSGFPGPYNVAGTIQDILQQRRETSRQAMLDKLSESQIQFQMGNQKRQTDLAEQAENRQKLATEAQIAASNEQRLNSKISSLPDTEFEVTDAMRGDKELYDALLQRGRIRTDTVTPKTGSSTDFQPPADASPDDIEAFARAMESGQAMPDMEQVAPTTQREMFTGSPEFQRMRYGQEQLRGVASSPEFEAEQDPLKKLLWLQSAGAQGINLQGLTDRSNKVYDHRGNLVRTDTLGPYDEVTQLPQPYQMPASLAPKEYQVLDARTGRPIQTVWMDAITAQARQQEFQQRGQIVVETSTPFGPNAGGERAKDLASREFSRAFTSASPRAQRAAELATARAQLIEATIVSDPAIKEFLSTVSENLLRAVDERGAIPSNIATLIMNDVQKNFPQIQPADIAEVQETINLLIAAMPKAQAGLPVGGN